MFTLFFLSITDLLVNAEFIGPLPDNHLVRSKPRKNRHFLDLELPQVHEEVVDVAVLALLDDLG